MTISIDLSEVAAVAAQLAKAPAQAHAAAYGAGKHVGKAVQSRAKSEAPRDRPWLATSGIRRRSWKNRDGAHTDIFTTLDPEGRNVGFHVEHGTTDAPPQPFLGPQMGWAGDAYAGEVVRRIDPFANPEVSGDDEG